jgi:hypothetical protein
MGSTGINVDETHVGISKRFLELVSALVDVSAAVVTVVVTGILGEELLLRAPVDALVRLPGIDTAKGEAMDGEAHVLQSLVAREDEEIGPRKSLAILLLDRP